ncbi:hypothetical protein GHT06_016278 [Daphnia sinensis]|uniref:Uncharacterized protein n=1 Tax=Daphnia sinensis TaxID=1820382 RepID=A0AAD5KNC4_9CRUS|nr:hypothetical protein GHT06_016278 [Daphnia sinensis]
MDRNNSANNIGTCTSSRMHGTDLSLTAQVISLAECQIFRSKQARKVLQCLSDSPPCKRRAKEV